AVFRIFQEALTNVARHAHAQHVEAHLQCLEEEGLIRLSVRDDGKGITTEALHSPTSLGLLGIRERARHFGGTVTFTRVSAEGGTEVLLEIPLGARRD